MAFDIKINFRATAGFVTDGAGETYSLSSDTTYPITRGGFTFGWNGAGVLGADENAALDPRLAGYCYNSVPREFIVDLPSSGSVGFHMAMGGAVGGNNFTLVVVDDASTLITMPQHNFTNGKYWDASEVERTSDGNWISSEAEVPLTFATTTARFQFDTVTQNFVINHIRLVSPPVGGGGGGGGIGGGVVQQLRNLGVY